MSAYVVMACRVEGGGGTGWEQGIGNVVLRQIGEPR